MILKEKILFTKNECDSIIWEETKNITNHSYMKDRKYYSQQISYNENTKWLFEKLIEFFRMETKLEITTIKNKIHFHKFEEGDWFGKHNDAINNRVYAIGVLLNDNFDGGDFKLYNSDEYTLSKQAGNTYIFDAKIDHEITKILSGERYSLLWFLHKDNLITKTII
jgi:Rps23 Pro-64 3,4-dihydroxylase Tpa1-like proline 4-hydroxylase